MSIKVHHHPLHPSRAVAVCDVCGAEEHAEILTYHTEDVAYLEPKSWKKKSVKKPGDKHWTQQHVCQKHHG